MRIALDWLRDYVDVPADVATLAHALTMSGTNIERVEQPAGDFTGVYVGKVLQSGKHPNADKLSVCHVEVGGEELHIVCGAPNVRTGLTVAVAKAGAVLPGDFKIRKSKIRGEVSEGMICSARELGMGQEHDGILELDAGLVSGTDFHAVVAGTPVLEAEITPNRPDCLSIWGVAREVAAVFDVELRQPRVWAGKPDSPSPVRVEIESAQDCARYLGRTIRGVRVGPSPDWLQQRLQSIGLQPINNVVDITNFVLFETGQPLHAFDLAQVGGGRIRVRRACAGESLRTLDGVDRRLDADILVIADATKPVALAGIMGGLDSAVTEATRDLLLEAAWFRPDLVRSGRRKLGLDTDASYRFERGADVEAARWAADRATQLFIDVTGATVAERDADEYPGPYVAAAIDVRVARINALIGTTLSAAAAAALLRRLRLDARVQGESIHVSVPAFRRDLAAEIDLVEEVARLHGYANIPDNVLPPAPLDPKPHQLDVFMGRLRQAAVGLGFNEARTSAFMDRNDPDRLAFAADDRRRRAVHVRNPIVKSLDTLRTHLLPNLLRAVRHNLHHGQDAVRLVQLDRIFVDEPGALPGLPTESERITLVACGRAEPAWWRDAARAYDLFDLKGDLASLCALAGVDTTFGHGYTEPFLEPQASFSIAGSCGSVGAGGTLREDVAKAFDIDVPVHVLDLDVALLLQLVPERRGFTPLPRFPAVKRDLSLVVPEDVRYESIESTARTAGGALLESVQCFDVFETAGQPRSVGIRLRFRAAERTLTDREIDPLMAAIARQLERALSVQLREN